LWCGRLGRTLSADAIRAGETPAPRILSGARWERGIPHS
jgi:hypothetical protein